MNNSEIATNILDCLFENAEEGFTKWELAVLIDVPERKIKAAMNEARELAVDIGYFIPTPLAGDGFKFRLTDNAEYIWAAQLFHEKQEEGIKAVRNRHAKAVEQRESQMLPEDRIISRELRKLQEKVERQQSELRAAFVDAAIELRHARDQEDGDAA